MEETQLLQERKGYKIYATDDTLIRRVEFTGPHAAFDNNLSCYIFEMLRDEEVSCHYVGQISDKEMSIIKLTDIPLDFVVDCSIEPEITYIKHEEGDKTRFYTRQEVLDSELLSEDALSAMDGVAFHLSNMLVDFFARKNLVLATITYNFGNLAEHFVVLAGQFTADTMCLLDPETGLRLDPNTMDNAYDIILERMNG